MEKTQLKQELQEYINNGDERLLTILYEAAVGYDTEKDDDLTAEDIVILEARRNARLNGESEVYDWETAKAMITSRK
jgi:hypothetical protein